MASKCVANELKTLKYIYNYNSYSIFICSAMIWKCITDLYLTVVVDKLNAMCAGYHSITYDTVPGCRQNGSDRLQ